MVTRRRSKLRTVLGIFVEAGERWSDDACYRLAASLAYYALFSIFPLILLAVTAVGFLLGDGDRARTRVLCAVPAPSPELRELLDQTLRSMQTHRTARGVGAALGFLTLLLGASGVFAELQSSLDKIWRATPPAAMGVWAAARAMVRSKALSFAIVMAAAFVILVSLMVSTALQAVGARAEGPAAGWLLWLALEMVVSVFFLTFLFASIYRLVPQTTVKWRDVFGAAFLTSLLFVVLKHLIAYYLARIAGYAAYGAVGAVLGLLTWIYVASVILFYGAEFGRVFAEHAESSSGRAARPRHWRSPDPG
jgi:membrane protein